MEFNVELSRELAELKNRWEYIFYDEIEGYSFVDTELEEDLISSLFFDTAKALDTVLPKKSADPLYYWEGVMGIFAFLKAFSVYPTVTDNDISQNFDIAKMIAKRLVEHFEEAREHYAPWNIFEDFTIPMDYLPDSYEKNPVGTAFIPYDLKNGDFTAIKEAIAYGGVYSE